MNKKKFQEKLFDYFDGFLIADKGIDFLLIFIGLVTALAFENYINENQTKREYVTYLARVHQELVEKQPVFDEINKTFDDSKSFTNDLGNRMKSGNVELVRGFEKIVQIQPSKLRTDNFRSIFSNDFLNNNLYSELFSLYSDIDNVQEIVSIKKEKLQDLYQTYYEISMLISIGENVNSELIRFNHLHSLQTTLNPINDITIIEVNIEKLLYQIEIEISSLGYNIEELKTYEDYLSLSSNYFYSDINLSINYAENGLKILKSSKIKKIDDPQHDNYILYNGQFHNNIAIAITSARKNGNYLDPEYLEKDILYNLEEWEKSAFNKGGNILHYADYYYSINNEELFLKYLNKYVNEEHSPNFLVGKLNSWRKFTDKDTVYSILSNFSKKYDRSDWEYEIRSDATW